MTEKILFTEAYEITIRTGAFLDTIVNMKLVIKDDIHKYADELTEELKE